MAKSKRFRAVLESDPAPRRASWITIPFDVYEVFGSRASVPVRGSLNGHTFRATLQPLRKGGGPGAHCLMINKAMRTETGIEAGATVSVVLIRDEEPRISTPPPDLLKALNAVPAARAAWDKLSYSHHRAYVEAIDEAKKPETRARRIEQAVNLLAAVKRDK